MKKILNVLVLLLFITAAFTNDAAASPDSTYRIMKKVADWQWSNLEKKGWRFPKTDWTNGAMYAGMMAFSEIANDAKYHEMLKRVGEENRWNTGPKRFFADDYCIGQMYSQLHQIYQNPEMIEKFRSLADSIVNRSHEESLEWKDRIHLREWAWCDALFMGPPALAYLSATTGDNRYLQTASALWWKTTDYLYDKETSLFFRDSRFFSQREKNGQKMFWSRGNGWVMGGLVRMLSNMPSAYPDKSRFESLFKAMAYKVAALQTSDGTWHASLLDPDNYPSKESSGTGFFVYALTWGINQGILPKKDFQEVIDKGWGALMECVQADGKIGFVQVPAAEPGKATADDTETYGTGAFLLAGSEILRMQLNQNQYTDRIEINNPSKLFRKDELIEIPYSQLLSRVPWLKRKVFKLQNVLTGKEVAYQLEYKGEKKPVNVLVLSTVAPGAIVYVAVKEGTPAQVDARTFARFVPERKDDFAWENDKVAFRMYGPALASTNENAWGIDVWSKRTSDLIINKWYQQGDYHKDHGQGMDYYSVGKTLGAGDIAPYLDDSIHSFRNFKTYKILDNGPLRSTFQLIYEKATIDGKPTTLTKTISLDAGSRMNKIEALFTYPQNKLPIVTGIVKRKGNGSLLLNEERGVLAYWEPEDPKAGITGVGCVMVSPVTQMKVAQGHLLSQAEINPSQPYTYYMGTAWSKAEEISDASQWFKYLDDFQYKLKNRLFVRLK